MPQSSVTCPSISHPSFLSGPSHHAAVSNSCLSAANAVPSCVTCTPVFPSDRPSPRSAKAGSRMRTLVLFVFLRAPSASACTDLRSQPRAPLRMCAIGVFVCVHVPTDPRMWNCSNLPFIKLPRSDSPLVCFSEGVKNLFWIYSFWEFVYNQ